jgi:hypothetical protein
MIAFRIDVGGTEEAAKRIGAIPSLVRKAFRTEIEKGLTVARRDLIDNILAHVGPPSPMYLRLNPRDAERAVPQPVVRDDAEGVTGTLAPDPSSKAGERLALLEEGGTVTPVHRALAIALSKRARRLDGPAEYSGQLRFVPAKGGKQVGILLGKRGRGWTPMWRLVTSADVEGRHAFARTSERHLPLIAERMSDALGRIVSEGRV